MVRQREINQPPQQRLPWEDRFNEPSLGGLRSALSKQDARLFDTAIDEFGAISGRDGEMSWQGECWKWTLAFTRRRRGQPTLEAVIIPNPNDFQIAVRIESEFISQLDDRRLKRAIRDGLALAADAFDTDWGVWTITSKPLLEDVIKLVRQHAEFAMDRADRN